MAQQLSILAVVTQLDYYSCLLLARLSLDIYLVGKLVNSRKTGPSLRIQK
jgi:hypothetical protein